MLVMLLGCCCCRCRCLCRMLPGLHSPSRSLRTRSRGLAGSRLSARFARSEPGACQAYTQSKIWKAGRKPLTLGCFRYSTLPTRAILAILNKTIHRSGIALSIVLCGLHYIIIPILSLPKCHKTRPLILFLVVHYYEFRKTKHVKKKGTR